jgi:hypothetical protein
MSSQDGKINFNNNKKSAISSRTRLESYELSREILKDKNKKSKDIINNLGSSNLVAINVQGSTSGKRAKKILTDKRQRGKKKGSILDLESNMKIDSYCMKKVQADGSLIEPGIIYNKSNYNNLSQMNPGENNDVSMSDIIPAESSPVKGVLASEEAEDYHGLSTKSSFNKVISFNEGVSNFSEQNVQESLFLKLVRSYIMDYSQEDLDDKFNLEKFIAENEDSLILSREPNYFLRQKYIDVRMRVILADWIMEVCSQLSFKRATFHSAVVLMDVFLSKMPDLKTSYLQLLGVTCLIISAKNEVNINENYNLYKIIYFLQISNFLKLFRKLSSPVSKRSLIQLTTPTPLKTSSLMKDTC